MIYIRLPGQLKYRDIAVRLIAGVCKLVDARRIDPETGESHPDPEFDREVISAFGEAFNNVVVHGYSGMDGDIEIEIETTPAEMTIRVLDYGRRFDVTAVPEPSLDSLPESGLGIFIMRRCMDDVVYTSDSSNVLTMTKSLTRARDRSGDDDIQELLQEGDSSTPGGK